MLFFDSQFELFRTLNATQKTTALYKAPILKKTRKTAKNWLFLTKNAFLTILRHQHQNRLRKDKVAGCLASSSKGKQKKARNDAVRVPGSPWCFKKMFFCCGKKNVLIY